MHWHFLAIRLLELIRLHIPEISEQIFNTVHEAASGNTGILQIVLLTSSFTVFLNTLYLSLPPVITDIKNIPPSLMK